jgi:hypothetical protein
VGRLTVFERTESRSENREKRAEIREQGTGNREEGTGNRDQGTKNREQGSKIMESKLMADANSGDALRRFGDGFWAFCRLLFLTAEHEPAGTFSEEGRRLPGWGIYPESTVTLHSRGN